MEAPQQMRRNSAASRAVAAASAHAALQLTPSPSPLLSRAQLNRDVPKLRKVDPRIFDEDIPEAIALTSSVVELQKRLSDLRPVEKKTNTIACLPRVLVQLIAGFVADNDVRSCASLCVVNRVFYAASLHLIRSVTLVPDVVSLERLSNPGAASSLAKFFDRSGRGQHIEAFTLVRPKHVYSLPAAVKGPEIHAQDLSRLVSQLPHLTFLDVRGITHRGFTPWCDHFLADVASACPKLRALRVGPVYLTTWEPGWWSALSELEEFTVGSRREDSVWTGGSGVPVTLPEDFFTMLRTLPLAARVKVWAPLAPTSFTALVMPTTPIPTLQHLSINAAGNTDHKPLEEAAKEAEAKEAAPAKGGAKGAKGAAKQQEASEGPRPTLPGLRSVVLCDIRDRPEFAVELMIRLMALAPGIEHWNVTNTQRTAPGKAPAVVATRGRGKLAQS